MDPTLGRLIQAGLLSLFLMAGTGAETKAAVIPQGSEWKYSTGTDLGTAWRDSAYDDSGWSSGNAVLGYGESFITTTIPFGPNASDKYPTAYFRKFFTMGAGSSCPFQAVSLAVNYDDSFVAYLNGQEIARRNITGTVLYTTRAAGNHEGGAFETISAPTAAGLLGPGLNILAVEVHQVNASSSDLVFDLQLSFANQSAEITRGPYLQVGTPEGVRIRWRTAAASDSRVLYGTHPDSLSGQILVSGSTTEHEVTLTGLESDTRYYYAVGTSSGDLTCGGEYTFRTQPPAGPTRPMRVWVIGDSGTGDGNAAAVRAGFESFAAGTETDVWLMLGDNAYNTGTDTEYQAAVFDMYPEQLRSIPLWPTRGNHDDLHGGPDNDYYDIFSMPDSAQAGGVPSMTEAYYSFDFADVHFVCLDSDGSDRSPAGAMLTWLAADLAANTRTWTIAFWHHPPYTKGSHDSDNPGDSGGLMRDMRENALPILEAGGVDLVLSGHSHSYERSFLLDEHYDVSTTLVDSMKIDSGDGRVLGDGAYNKPTLGPAPHEGAVYVVAGSSGKLGGGSLNHPVMVVSLNQLGSVVLDIDDRRLTANFLDVSGQSQDDFSMVKGNVVGVPSPTTPGGLRLAPPRPNPAAFAARIAFTLPRAGPVRLSVVDVRGSLVARLIDGPLPGGDHVFVWNARDSRSRLAPPGVYFTVLEAGSQRRTRKIVLQR